MILGEAGLGIADGAEDAGIEVASAVDVVDDVVLNRVVEHAVDREVAALGVGGRVAVMHVVGASTVAVIGVAAEGGDFDLVFVQQDHDHAELGADLQGAAE